MSPIIEGNVTYSNINYDQVVGRAQGDSDVTEAQGYDQNNIQFDFYTGDCSSYKSLQRDTLALQITGVWVYVSILRVCSRDSWSGNVFVCNPMHWEIQKRIDAQATNQISVDCLLAIVLVKTALVTPDTTRFKRMGIHP